MRNGEGLQPYRSFSVLPFRPDSKVDVRVRARSSPSKDRMQIVRPVPLAVRRREHANGDVQPSHVSAAPLCLSSAMRRSALLHASSRYGAWSTSCASLRHCAAGLSRRCRMLLKHGGRRKKTSLVSVTRCPSKREKANFSSEAQRVSPHGGWVDGECG